MASQANSDHSAGTVTRSMISTQPSLYARALALSLQMLQQAAVAAESNDAPHLPAMSSETFDFDDALRAFEAPAGQFNGKRASQSSTVHSIVQCSAPRCLTVIVDTNVKGLEKDRRE
jgi:hypothetical protein